MHNLSPINLLIAKTQEKDRTITGEVWENHRKNNREIFRIFTAPSPENHSHP